MLFEKQNIYLFGYKPLQKFLSPPWFPTEPPTPPKSVREVEIVGKLKVQGVTGSLSMMEGILVGFW